MIQVVQNRLHKAQSHTFGKNKDRLLTETEKETPKIPPMAIDPKELPKTIKPNKIAKFFGDLGKVIKQKKLLCSTTLLSGLFCLHSTTVAIQKQTHNKNEQAIYKQVSLPDYQKIKYNDSLIQHNGFNPYYAPYYRDIIDSIRGKNININEKYKIEGLRKKATIQNAYEYSLKNTKYLKDITAKALILQRDSITNALNHQIDSITYVLGHQRDSTSNAINHQLDSTSLSFDKTIKQLQKAAKKAAKKLR